MEEYKDEIELMDYLNVIWKKKWLIILPTLFCVIIAGIISFRLPRIWEVDAIIQPSKFFVQNEAGTFSEVVVVSPKQIAGQINQQSYSPLIAAELNLDIRAFPGLKAENLRDTNLVRVSVRENDTEKAKLILSSLFNHLKTDMDRKIDVEIKGIDTRIEAQENSIKQNELTIKDKLNEIKLKEIEKNMKSQEILSAVNKVKISEDRGKSILNELKTVKERINEIEKQQKNAFAEKKEGAEALGLLLYSNEIQNNLRYYNTLDEKLSSEKIIQENLDLQIKAGKEEIRKLDNQIEKVKTEIDKIKNMTENIKNEINLLNEKKGRIDYAQLIKEPTSSLSPVSPRKKLNVLIAGILSLMIFTILAFFLEYIRKNKAKEDKV